jgi:hypothetical protein
MVQYNQFEAVFHLHLIPSSSLNSCVTGMVFVIVNNYDGNFSPTNLFIFKTLKKFLLTYGAFEPLTNLVLEEMKYAIAY